MAALVYLTVRDVLGLHRFIMDRTGGVAAPVRDEGLLDGALMRLRSAAYYEGADLRKGGT
ncbi:MAG: hypothetical protein M3Q65_03290 [Chloroflexota bacterium]|nr:hypothetical protein [Chloroflexota bacterium]